MLNHCAIPASLFEFEISDQREGWWGKEGGGVCGIRNVMVDTFWQGIFVRFYVGKNRLLGFCSGPLDVFGSIGLT